MSLNFCRLENVTYYTAFVHKHTHILYGKVVTCEGWTNGVRCKCISAPSSFSGDGIN